MMSALRSKRRLVGYRRGSFPRPLTIYAGNFEYVSLDPAIKRRC